MTKHVVGYRGHSKKQLPMWHRYRVELYLIFPASVMPRYTEPNPEQAFLLHQLNLTLPQQPPPRISTPPSSVPFLNCKCSGDLPMALAETKHLPGF